ncbi:MAG: hypothetical protein US62_C0013G0011 [Candidatus Woesebacteria bacterium GW2011_GWA1_37_8]|uniref:ATP synthase F1 complex delta/epsilon subunit N-terminal domain-containing protein n=2 Tax=Candidatus Woeseibacteriota TaxID=1752722 RepID=A0A0G0LG54_9BACT|nr:MAG: hypothetical protein US39_C0013G0009 [Microgenomates group bacterium GW2011_GWC1_37_12b]KKQ45558.1 MAG: hypothetical protein US62_C0013G0011 [Candidatus Woesebacteria bacterium GW2011_GWA1_37_8]KKQ86920.1 MAG: hypothetical protein UT10_C0014G0009 [Candidatus Woesebacteria bacterium GW2011_GWB1_38_8b]
MYQGQVASITSFNKKGKFDVLPQHANFISLIQRSLVIRDNKGEVSEIKVSNGLMRVKEDRVEVYIGIEGSAGLKDVLKV